MNSSKLMKTVFMQVLFAAIAAVAVNTAIYLQIWLYIVIILASVVFLVLIFRDYTIGLVIMIFLIPLDSAMEIIPRLTLVKVIGIITFAAFLLSRKKKKIILPDVRLMLFFAYIAVSVLWAIDKWQAFERLINLLNYLFFLIIMINAKFDDSNIKKYISPYIFGSIILALLGIYNFFIQGGGERVAAFSGENMNFYGLTLGVAVLCSTFMLITERKGRIYIPISLLLISGQIVSMSRTAWIATISALFIFYTGSRVNVKRLPKAIAGITVAVTVPFFFFMKLIPGAIDSLVERFATIFTLSDGASGRLDIWAVAFDIFKDNLLIGVGINNFPVAFTYGYLINSRARMGIGLNRDPHSMYISILVELGVVGMTVFLVMLFSMFGYAFHTRKNEKRDFCISLLIFIMTAGISSTILFKKYYWYVFSLFYIVSDFSSMVVNKGGE